MEAVRQSRFLSIKIGTFGSNVLILMTGMALSQAANICLAPIITRLYDPTDLGTLSIFMSLSSILAVIACLRYDAAIMLPKDVQDASNLLFASLLLAVLIATLTFVFSIFTQQQAARTLNVANMASWLWLLGPTVLLLGLMQAMQIWCNRNNDFKRTATSYVIRALTDNGTKITLGLTSMSGYLGLISGFISGVLVAASYLTTRFLTLDYIRHMRSVSKRNLKIALVRYRSFPFYNSWAALMDAGSLQVPILLLTYFYGSHMVGLYALATRVLRLPAAFIGRASSQALFKKISDNIKAELPVFPLVVKSVVFLSIVALLPLGLLAWGGEWIFQKVFGEEWRLAGYYARIMVGWVGMQYIASAVSPVFLALERNRCLGILQIILLMASVLPILFSHHFQYGEVGVVKVLSITNSAVYGLYLFASLVICKMEDNRLKRSMG